jgi:hypothetical protein
MENYIVSIISAFLGYVSSRFANRKTKGILPTIGVLSILATTAAGLTFLGRWIITPSPTPQPPLIEREKDRLEGQWVEKYKEGGRDTYAIATIRYNSDAKYLEFYGNAYDSSLNLVGHWQTIQARLEGNQYDYLFTGESYDLANPGHRKGVGGIWFLDNRTHGKGNFFSVRADKELREFELYKILDEDAARQSINDPKGFIQKLYKNPSYLKQVASAGDENNSNLAAPNNSLNRSANSVAFMREACINSVVRRARLIRALDCFRYVRG